MDWLERMNNALEYIENSLDEDIDYKKIAKAASCSEFHFSRMFSSISGVSLSEYIRRRRLTLAAFEIQKVIFELLMQLLNMVMFLLMLSRVLLKMHGITPSNARNKGVQLKAFPRISFQISIKGDTEMEYRIENLDFELRIVGKSKRVKTSSAFKNSYTLEQCEKDGFMQELIDMSWEDPKCKLESLLGFAEKMLL